MWRRRRSRIRRGKKKAPSTRSVRYRCSLPGLAGFTDVASLGTIKCRARNDDDVPHGGEGGITRRGTSPRPTHRELRRAGPCAPPLVVFIGPMVATRPHNGPRPSNIAATVQSEVDERSGSMELHRLQTCPRVRRTRDNPQGRRGRESNPRYLLGTHDFQSCTFGHSVTSPFYGWLRALLAEREGFEPPVPFRVHLISNQAPSTGLGHLSILWVAASPRHPPTWRSRVGPPRKIEIGWLRALATPPLGGAQWAPPSTWPAAG